MKVPARPTLATQEARPPTRRRGSKLEAALLQAAWDELTEAGYTAFTMEGVAARAKTSRAVLYRRWPNRPELVVAALHEHRNRPVSGARHRVAARRPPGRAPPHVDERRRGNSESSAS